MRSRGYQRSAASSEEAEGQETAVCDRRVSASGEGRRRNRQARVESLANECVWSTVAQCLALVRGDVMLSIIWWHHCRWDKRGGVHGSSRKKPTPVPAGSFTVRCPVQQEDELISPSGFEEFNFSKAFLTEVSLCPLPSFAALAVLIRVWWWCYRCLCNCPRWCCCEQEQIERRRANKKGWKKATKGIALTSSLLGAAKDKQAKQMLSNFMSGTCTCLTPDCRTHHM